MGKREIEKQKSTKKRRGRPSRQDVSEAALSGVNIADVDPLAVLRAIAADSSAPASARVAAAKALIAEAPARTKENEPAERDPIARRALRILNGGKA